MTHVDEQRERWSVWSSLRKTSRSNRFPLVLRWSIVQQSGVILLAYRHVCELSFSLDLLFSVTSHCDIRKVFNAVHFPVVTPLVTCPPGASPGLKMWGAQQAKTLKGVWRRATSGVQDPWSGSQAPWSRKLFGACTSIGVGKVAPF